MGMFDFGISAMASHVNKLLDIHAQNKQQAREYDRQKEFAQNGIRWRVEDAKAAGIHPLAALGAHTMSYSPQAVTGADYGIGDLGQALGQNIDRAVNAKATEMERAQAQADLDFRNAQTDLVRAQTYQVQEDTANAALASLDRINNQQQVPAMPKTNQSYTPAGGKSDEKPSIINQVTFIRDPLGRLVSLGNTQEYHDMNEDVPIMELVPALVSMTWDARVKITGEPVLVDGKWYAYNRSRQEYLPVNIKVYKPRWKNWFMSKAESIQKSLYNAQSRIKSGGIRAFYGG